MEVPWYGRHSLYGMSDKPRPILARRFWDVVFEQLDYDAKASFIIERVFERGDVEDIRQCRRYYGDERAREVLSHALSRIYPVLGLFLCHRPLHLCQGLQQVVAALGDGALHLHGRAQV